MTTRPKVSEKLITGIVCHPHPLYGGAMTNKVVTTSAAGVVPTPLVYFATHQLETRSGVMVTGSHNPAHHNGFKIVLNGRTLSMEGAPVTNWTDAISLFVLFNLSLRIQSSYSHG